MAQEQTIDFTNVKPYPDRHLEDERASLASIATLLKESTTLLPILRREFRGEAIQQKESGGYTIIQLTKPMFVRMDNVTQEPLRQEVTYEDENGVQYKKQIYIPNDEAIEELLSILKFMGLNQITLLTNIDENTILDDLREFECKLAGLLCLKQKEWGIDKELLPIMQSKIKTIVQDARYQACNGSTLKAIQKTVQRIEHMQEGTGQLKYKNSPYN